MKSRNSCRVLWEQTKKIKQFQSQVCSQDHFLFIYLFFLGGRQKKDLLGPKSGLFEPHPSLNAPTKTPFLAQFVAISRIFADFGVHCLWACLKPLAVKAVAKPHSPGRARVALSSFFPQISINSYYFSSNLSYLLPHFGPLGGWVAHPGRPWLRHCWQLGYVP